MYSQRNFLFLKQITKTDMNYQVILDSYKGFLDN